MTEPADIDQAPGDIVGKHGRLDIVVSNAGIARDQLLMRMKRDDWDAVMATNLTATFTLTQAAIRPMLKQRGGRIIAIGSIVGVIGNAGQANYAASKAGLIGFAKALAREVASRGITVNVIAPGMIDTDMTRAINEKAQVDWAAQIPLGRLGTPDDVAAAACYLASDEASYITGHVLAVNGGMNLEVNGRIARRSPGPATGEDGLNGVATSKAYREQLGVDEEKHPDASFVDDRADSLDTVSW